MSSSNQLPKIDGGNDAVQIVGYWDSAKKNHRAIPIITLRFDDRLLPDKLRLALTYLLDTTSWRRLGGRLRQVHGRLELHIPAIFNKHRPSFAWSQEKFDIGINEHPLAARLPTASPLNDAPRIFDAPDAFAPLTWGPNLPRSLDDFVLTDHPMLSAHVASFTDATLVSLSWPHIMSDIMGVKNLIDAWALVLAGREDDVLPLCAQDPMENLGIGPCEDLTPRLAKMKV